MRAVCMNDKNRRPVASRYVASIDMRKQIMKIARIYMNDIIAAIHHWRWRYVYFMYSLYLLLLRYNS